MTLNFAGVMYHEGARIQILDLPGIIEGAKDGRGRGRQVRGVIGVISVTSTSVRCLKPLLVLVYETLSHWQRKRASDEL